MKVNELMEILKDINGDLDINIIIERGRGLSVVKRVLVLVVMMMEFILMVKKIIMINR